MKKNNKQYQLTALDNSLQKQNQKNTKEYNYKQFDDLDIINGPVQSRTCTDIFCCLLFLLSFFLFLCLAMYGYIFGHPMELLAFYDTSLNQCTGSYNFAYMPNLQTIPPDFSVICLSSCPIGDSTPIHCQPDNKFCTNSPNYTFIGNYGSSGIDNVYCIPTQASIANGFSQRINLNYFTQIFADIKITYLVLLGSLGASFLLGIIYFTLMSCCAGFMIWGSIISFISFILGIGIYIFLYTKGITFSVINLNLSTYNIQSLQYTSYGLWCLGILTILIVLCFYKKLRLGIAIIKSTSLYISETCHIVFIPPIIALFLIIFIATLITAFFFLYSLGTLIKNSPFAEVNRDRVTNDLIYYQISAGVWILFFISGLNSFILSSSACIWYFGNSSIQQKPHRPVSTSFFRAIRYHGGSIAFASLLLSLLFLIRLIVTILKIKSATADQGKFMAFFFKCIQCCLCMFNSCLKFLNKGAYIQIALKGRNYCVSSFAAFTLITQNPIQLTLNQGLSSMIMIIGKLTISAAVAVAAYYIVIQIQYYIMLVSNPLTPTIISGLIAYSVSSLYMSIFGTSSNAIIQCFILDECINRKKGQKAIYCPAPLRQIIEQNNE